MTQEEFLVRLGVDPTSLDAGTQLAVGRQKKRAIEVSDAWAVSEKSITATAKTQAEIRDANEDYLNKKSLARLAQRTEAERAAAAEWTANYSKRAAERDEIAAISNGSGGYSMVGKNGEKPGSEAGANAGMAANVAAQTLASGGSLKDVGIGVGGVAAGVVATKATEHAVNSTAFREVTVLIREGLRNSMTRMIGSFSILATSLRIAGSVFAGLVVDIPFIVAGAYEYHQMRKASALEKSTGENLKVSSSENAESLRQMVSELNRAGKISDSDAAGYARSLKNPTYENVSRVQRDLLPFMKNGTAKQQLAAFEAEKKDSIQKEDDRAAKERSELDSLLAKKRDEIALEDDIKNKRQAISDITQSMAILESKHLQDTRDYHAAIAKLTAEVDLQKDLTRQAQQQADLAKSQKDWKEWSDRSAVEYMKSKIHDGMDEAEYLSVEDLAGRTYTKRLAAQYGIGGIYDLGRGDGAFADTARDYERAKYQQQYDRTYGNIGAADQDRQRMISARDFLVKSGAASPEMQLSKIEDNTAKLHALFNSLVSSGALNTSIRTDD